MRRILFAVAVVCFLTTASYAQNNNEVNGVITAAATSCTLTPSPGCISIPIPANVGGVSVSISGTFSGTLLFEAANDNANFTAIQGIKTADGTGATSATSPGTWQFSVSGLSVLHVRGNPFSTGSAIVFIRVGQGVPFAPATISGTFSGNAAAGTTGVTVPASAGYTGVIVGGNLVGVSGTGTSMNVNVTGGVATGSNFASAFPSTGQAIGVKNGANMVNLTADGSNNLNTAVASVSSGAVASGAYASGSIASGAYASGSISDGAMVTVGAKTDNKSTATDTTSVSLISLNKEISFQVQASASSLTTVTSAIGAITSGGVPTDAVLMGFKNNAGTQMVPITLDASGNLPVSGSLSVSPNATFGSAAPSTGFMMGFRNGSNADYAVTNGSHQPQIEIANITAAATGPQSNANSDSVVISPYQLSFTDKSGSISTGGTSQQLAASNSSRHALIVINPTTASDQGISTAEWCYINFTSSAAAASSSIPLPPGASYFMGGGNSPVSTEQVNINCPTTAHKYVAKEQ